MQTLLINEIVDICTLQGTCFFFNIQLCLRRARERYKPKLFKDSTLSSKFCRAMLNHQEEKIEKFNEMFLECSQRGSTKKNNIKSKMLVLKKKIELMVVVLINIISYCLVLNKWQEVVWRGVQSSCWSNVKNLICNQEQIEFIRKTVKRNQNEMLFWIDLPPTFWRLLTCILFIFVVIGPLESFFVLSNMETINCRLTLELIFSYYFFLGVYNRSVVNTLFFFRFLELP